MKVYEKNNLKETIITFLLIPVLFLYFKKGATANPPYEFAYLLIFLLVKKIRDNLFTKSYLVGSLILAVILTASSYKAWINDITTFILIIVKFFITVRGFIMLWQMLKENYADSDMNSLKNPRMVFFEIFAAVFISLSLFWLSQYYPSGISPDTVNQWEQIHGILPFTDIHAPFHTLLLKCLLKIRDGYDIVILFQIFLISLLAGLFSKYFYEKGINSQWLLIANIIFSFSIMSTYYMYPYKDIPYTFVLGIITYLLMRLTDDFKPKIIYGVLWGGLLTVCYYLRYNGIVCAVFLAIYLICIFIKKRYFKPLISFVASLAVLSIGVYFIIYNVMGCEHKENGFSLQVFGSGISAVVAQDGNISEEELQRVDEILGIDWIKAHYNRWQMKDLIWTPETDDPDGFFEEHSNEVYNNFFVVGMGTHKMEVIKLYFSLFIKNPLICMKDFFYNTYQIWGYMGVFSNVFLTIILLSSFLVFWRGKQIKMNWIVFVPILLNVLSIAVSTITKELRYLLPTVTLFPPLLFYVIASGKRMKTKTVKETIENNSN